ncbi:hypothetical protein BH11MYX2_BH11MYX2_33150 [soil metagenome]
MPSPKHELLVELFRQQPALAPALLRLCARVEVPGERAVLMSSDLSQTMPAEYRTDALVVMRDDAGAEIAAIVVEVQLKVDAEKRFTWPLYVAASWARFRCPVTLLVIAPEAKVAAWARTQIDVGAGWSFAPTVIDFAHVPRVEDPADARGLPELAVMSALYWDSVLAALPLAARRLVEQHMLKDYEYQSDFFRNLQAQEAAAEAKGLAKGQAEGLAKGQAEGLAKGQAEGELRALLVFIRKRFGDVPAALEERLRTFDAAGRERVLERVLSARSIEELVAE